MSTAVLEESPQAATSRLRTDTLAASVVLMLVMTVLQRLIGFGRGVLFCRWLDPEQLGQWDVAFGFVNLAAPLAVLGLPGSFGRYFEYYRGRGQLRAFLSRTTLLCTVSAAVALVGIALARDWFSQLIFGSRDEGTLVLFVVGCLSVVIVHNFLGSMFMAARLYRVVTLLQFVQSLLFAAISLALCVAWQATAAAAVVGFGLATLVCLAGAYPMLRQVWQEGSNDLTEPAPQRAFWAKLLPFAGWVWVTNLLANLFEIIDRYMIVHFSGLDPEEALRQVGYYHSSRLVPLLFVAVAALLGSMITPHLSHDWEAGRTGAVCRRLNTVLKGLALAVFAGSVAMLLLGPTLFNVVLGGKFAAGLQQLPLTLAACTWFGMISVAQNYLWCREKAWLSSLALLLGLLLNVGLNMLLLPRLGLHGAVLSTTVANFVALSLIYAFSWRLGMQIDRGTLILSALPALLWLGAVPALLALVAVLVWGLATESLFDREEKQHLLVAVERYRHKARQLLRPRAIAACAALDPEP